MTSARTGSPYRRGLTARWGRWTPHAQWVPLIAVGLIVVQLIVRGVVAFGGYFYWDDLILVSRAGTHPLLSWEYLFDDHDGHVMPGAFLVAGGITRVAPLVWAGPAVSLVVMQLLVSLALLRALHVILGWRPVLLIPLTFALFCPVMLPAFAWWAAALNSLPMLAAMAWVCGDAIMLVRTGNRRYAVTGTVVFLGGLLFFEKAAVIPVVAFVVTALLAYVGGDDVPWRTVWAKGRRLWLGSFAVLGFWIVIYLVVVDQRRWGWDFNQTGELLMRSVTHGLVPTLAGGPWAWERWDPVSPWAEPGPVVMALGWLVVVSVVAVSVARKHRIRPVWAAAVGYVAACQVPIYLMRSSQFTGIELAQTLRYLPDLGMVLALLAAVAFCAPNKADSTRLDASRARTAVVVGLAVAFVGSSLYSTSTFLTSWRDNPTRSYLDNARAGLAAAPRDVPLLDQEIDAYVLQRLSWPENLASHLFALLPERPQFDTATTEVRMLDKDGRMVDAQATWVRYTLPGPVESCGYLVQPDAPVEMPLDGPLLPEEWTTEINYLANIYGSMTVSLNDGDPVKVPVAPGLNRVFVRLSGAGDGIVLSADTTSLSLCIASGPVGYVAPI